VEKLFTKVSNSYTKNVKNLSTFDEDFIRSFRAMISLILSALHLGHLLGGVRNIHAITNNIIRKYLPQGVS